MTTPQTNLRVRISGELSDIKQGLLGLRKDLEGVKRGAREALSADNNRFVAGIKQVRAQVVGLVASYASLQGVQAFARISDQANQLRGRLKLATRDQESFNRAQRDTFDIAQRNQTSLATTVDLYSRLSRATQKIGLGGAQQSALTETILQAGRLSFASEEGLNSAIVQLGQGLSSGQLRGEELNSVLEQTPRLAQAIQDGLLELGVKGAENLRELAKEGQLTPELIVKAILTQQQRLAAEAKNLPPTIAGAFTQLSNAVLRFVQDSNEANTAAQTIIAFLKAIAENLPLIVSTMVTATRIAVAYFLLFRAAPAAIALAAGALELFKNQVIATRLAQELGIKTAVTWASGLKAAAGIALSAFIGWEIGTYLKNQFLEVELAGIALTRNLMIGFELLKRGLSAVWETITFTITNALAIIRNTAADSFARMADVSEKTDIFGLNRGFVAKAREWSGALRTSGQSLDELGGKLAKITADSQQQVASIGAEFDALAAAAIDAKLLADDAANAGGDTGAPVGGDGDGKVRAAVNRLELLQDATERALRALDQAYADGEISLQDYFRKRAELETTAIDLAIQAARAELQTAESVEAQGKALTQIVKLQRDRAEIGPRLAREQAAAERELANELQNLGIRLLELEGNTEAAAAVRLGQQFQKLREQLLLEGNTLGLELMDRVFNAELAKQKLDAITSQTSAAMAKLRTETDYLASQQEVGGLSPVDAERELQRVREATLVQLRKLREEAQAAFNQKPGDDTFAALRELDTQILQLIESQKQFKNAARQEGVTSLQNFFNNFANGAKLSLQSFKDLVVGFIQGLARMASELLAKQIIFSLFGMFGGGGGPLSFLKSGGGGLKAIGVKHSGGAPDQGTKRMIPRGLFNAAWADAPRFHEGVNLAANEIPAILQDGERVLSRQQNRALGEQAGGQKVVQPIVVLGEQALAGALAGAAGREIVLTHVRDNLGALGLSQR
jgi:tape measure domain-containing protein